MTKAKLVLLRHGQTQDNVDHVNSGQNDVPLTATGEKQARAAGPLISDIIFDKVFSSPLSRAFNTASLALEAAGQNIAIEKRQEIIEQNDGILNGLSMSDPLVVDYFKEVVYDIPPPGGESDKQLADRVRKFYAEDVLPRLKRGENVLIVAHTGTIRAFDKVIGFKPPPPPEGEKKKRRSVINAGPAVHEFDDGVLKNSYDIENPETTKAAQKRKSAANKKPEL